MNRFDELGLKYRCEYCLAGVGTWCRTRSGAVATGLHAARLDPVMLAYSDGYLDASKTNTTVGTITYTGNWPQNQSSTGNAAG